MRALSGTLPVTALSYMADRLVIDVSTQFSWNHPAVPRV